jgi:hypothetical protein
MLRPDEERKACNLVPLWLLDTDNPALAKMAKRPVNVDIDELGVSLSGELKELSLTHARVMPDRSFFLCGCVYVEIRFRYLDTVYTLSGQAAPSLPDHSFVFDFDSVARKLMGDLSKQLGALGLLDPSREPPRTAVAGLPTPEQEHGQQLTPRQLARRVRHSPPPGGNERRCNHRYDMDTGAHVTLVRDARAVECRMVDISRSGCRLYFEEPSGIKPGTMVEVQFTENGFPLRLAAVVQVRTNEFSAGLRFVRNSERMVERLDSLLRELAELTEGGY